MEQDLFWGRKSVSTYLFWSYRYSSMSLSPAFVFSPLFDPLSFFPFFLHIFLLLLSHPPSPSLPPSLSPSFFQRKSRPSPTAPSSTSLPVRGSPLKACCMPWVDKGYVPSLPPSLPPQPQLAVSQLPSPTLFPSLPPFLQNTDTLNLDAAGLTSDKRGLLDVNSFYQTTNPHYPSSFSKTRNKLIDLFIYVLPFST